ncbi:hypothetical protein AB0C27_39675 [Nonomuraea sp. NPDC048882]|uniref:hypothetical protein n=1 Tax=Nonomuraea TaxID=83681 RepID=UPI002DDC0C86|nr:hypothetical protein [Nonomuraea fuscirosea]WSA52681.1 hypothetical protein OIE67_53210 [Nonomuraea fuscirosea]
MSRVLWSKMAEADLIEIGEAPVISRILKAAEGALVFPPRRDSPDEGYVRGREGSLAWRRAIPLTGAADDCDEAAANRYFVYRAPSDREYREADRHVIALVERVLPLSELASVRD